jgi:CBS domain-containing protein
MWVRNLLRSKGSNVITVGPDEDLGDVVALLMRHDIGAVPVVQGDRGLLGLISERDVARAVHRNRGDIRELPAARVMRRPAPTCSADDSLHHVMARMTRRRLRHLVVLDGRRMAGVISVGDLVKQRLEQLETETAVLRDYVTAQRALG